MDRNLIDGGIVEAHRVALLAEGVDRNYAQPTEQDDAYVALLAEGVDRNASVHDTRIFGNMSPSSRRAWIEIAMKKLEESGQIVALLAEGVDRNPTVRAPSFRAAVALLAEGVDRNCLAREGVERVTCRPPRGGRG